MIAIDSADDPRIAPYHTLKEHPPPPDEFFLFSEGPAPTRLLLESGLPVESVLTIEKQRKKIEPHVPHGLPFYVMPNALLEAVAGSGYKSGVYARAPKPPPRPLEDLIPNDAKEPALLAVLPRITTLQNVGAIARSAAGLGASGMLIGPGCADPLHRHGVRASMGTIFLLPWRRARSLEDELDQLKRERGFQLAAATLEPGSLPLRQAHGEITPPGRVALLLGHETDGLSPELEALCDLRFTLPMSRGVDSLNVAAAATLFLYAFSGGEHSG